MKPIFLYKMLLQHLLWTDCKHVCLKVVHCNACKGCFIQNMHLSFLSVQDFWWILRPLGISLMKLLSRIGCYTIQHAHIFNCIFWSLRFVSFVRNSLSDSFPIIHVTKRQDSFCRQQFISFLLLIAWRSTKNRAPYTKKNGKQNTNNY